MNLTIYSKSACTFCEQAKQYLAHHDIPYTEIDIEQDSESRQFMQDQGHRTVPQIYYQGRLFVAGGWQQLSKLTADDIRNEIGLRDALASETL